VNTVRLQEKILAVCAGRDGLEIIEIAVKGRDGEILPEAIASVRSSKTAAMSKKILLYDSDDGDLKRCAS
jgi:hypothetical protein